MENFFLKKKVSLRKLVQVYQVMKEHIVFVVYCFSPHVYRCIRVNLVRDACAKMCIHTHIDTFSSRTCERLIL